MELELFLMATASRSVHLRVAFSITPAESQERKELLQPQLNKRRRSLKRLAGDQMKPPLPRFQKHKIRAGLSSALSQLLEPSAESCSPSSEPDNHSYNISFLLDLVSTTGSATVGSLWGVAMQSGSREL
ncbi:hypothetical protein SRHO_G00139600 [Serrasalmus rhombeus]